jgi:ABC-type branched-subunit amino acid transport system substrate-binding protein
MKKSYNVVAILVTTLILSGLFAMACGPKAPAGPESTGPVTINIGVCAAMSGPAASYGKLGQETVDTFLQVFNRQGFKVGNQTYNFKVITADDQANSEGGSAAAKKLVYEDGCKFIVGHWTPNFKAIQAVTNPAKVIFFSHTGSDAVPGPGGYDPKTMPYVAFPVAAHEVVVAYIFGIAEANPNYKKIGIIDTVLNKGIGWDNADKQMDEKGIRYFHQFTQPNTADYAPFITKCAEEGCDFIFTPDVAAALAIVKQRWEMGYKDIKICCAGPITSPTTWAQLAGYDAIQGLIVSSGAVWEAKNRPLNAEQIAMLQETMRLLADKHNGSFTYTGWIPWTPTQLFILSQAMQKAGTVDDTDALMQVIRGGTFDLPTGQYAFSGAQTYGSPVVMMTGIIECQIQGDKEVYYSQYHLPPLP